ncbi:GrpB family protein [Streptococcus intermedius]|uniref:GrpB family protein n=1 Tax=Streptococcus intermedius TaxID=1338 RepID=UPI000E3DACEA|nr:GrpB family protein [Streptococcus intermedius]RSJ13054.1 dephospho-CoA kinase/protein folding accessory domain-containing protein [Streptococcus intermedius]
MSKKLENMSLEEIWQLFPIFLVKHNKEWADWYDEEATAILSLIPAEYIVRISHIGSTAVQNIWAKNIVDILLEVRLAEELEIVKNILVENKWLCMSQSTQRISLNKGYTEQGFAEKVFHLHIRVVGDNDELYFRDYLRENHNVAKEYEHLKLNLWKKFEHDRDGYTDAKREFVKRYTKVAKEKFIGRY